MRMNMTNAQAASYLNALRNTVKGKYEAENEVQTALDMGIDALNEQRPHGKWILKTDYFGRSYYECSECKAEQKQHFVEFCGRCGTDMRGGLKP